MSDRAHFLEPSVGGWIRSLSGKSVRLLEKIMAACADPSVGKVIYPMRYADANALEADRFFVENNPKRTMWIRPLIGEERKVGQLAPGFTDRVLVILMGRRRGLRVRFVFGCPVGSEAARLDMTEKEIASLALLLAGVPE